MALRVGRDTRTLSGAGSRRAEIFWGVFVSLMFALAFSYPILANITGLGLDHDWDQTMEMHWAPFYTVIHFHQFPLWDPYKCGRIALLGNPPSRILTPFLLLHLLFGPLIGIHLEIIAHLAIGFGGAYLLARVVDIGKLGAVACGATFAGSSWYYIRLAEGHSVFLCIMYIPWALALFWMGWRSRKLAFAAPTGLVGTLIFFEGGIYQITHLALVLAVLAIVVSLQYRSLFPLALLVTAGVFAVAFSAPKFLPTVHFVGLNPRSVDPFEKNSFSMFVEELFSRNQFFSRDSMGGFWGFWEFGAYIGIIFGAMAMLGIALAFSSCPALVDNGADATCARVRKSRDLLTMGIAAPSPDFFRRTCTYPHAYAAGTLCWGSGRVRSRRAVLAEVSVVNRSNRRLYLDRYH